jgi:hypothetical protein
MRGHVKMRASAYLVPGVFLPKVFLLAWYVEASFLRVRVRQIPRKQATVRKFADKFPEHMYLRELHIYRSLFQDAGHLGLADSFCFLVRRNDLLTVE